MEYVGRLIAMNGEEILVKKSDFQYGVFTMSTGLSHNVNKYHQLGDKILVETKADVTIAKAIVLKGRY